MKIEMTSRNTRQGKGEDSAKEGNDTKLDVTICDSL